MLFYHHVDDTHNQSMFPLKNYCKNYQSVVEKEIMERDGINLLLFIIYCYQHCPFFVYSYFKLQYFL